MSEKKFFKKQFAKKENFDLLKIDINIFSFELPNVENTEISYESCNLVKIPHILFYVIHHL